MPAAPGEVGRLVVTPFYNYAMPLVRYALGDFVQVGVPGVCLRKLPVLRHILGRDRNSFVMPDGSRVWPAMRPLDLRRFLGHNPVQMVQTAPANIEVRYVSSAAGPAPDAAALQDHVRSALHPDLAVRTIAVDTIPRLPSGKREDYVSLAGQEAPRT